jgi:hypothetical protein
LLSVLSMVAFSRIALSRRQPASRHHPPPDRRTPFRPASAWFNMRPAINLGTPLDVIAVAAVRIGRGSRVDIGVLSDPIDGHWSDTVATVDRRQ